MRKIYFGITMLLLMALLAACGSTGDAGKESDAADKIVIKHQLGETSVTKNPKNVVVFDLGFLDTLDELGVEVAAVPQQNLPEYLKQYKDKKYTNAGSLKEPDFEAISRLKPEVIFISTRQQELYDELSEIAPTVFVGVDPSDYLNSFKENVGIAGKLFDKEEEAKEALAEVEGKIDALKEKAASVDEKALIVLGTEGKVSAYGPSSRFGLIHDEFGFPAADEKIEVSTHGQSITFEYILEKNPDILFVIDRDAAVGNNASVKDSIENELVKKTNAYKNKKIIYLDPGYWYLSGGGLQSVSKMVEEVEAAIQ